MKHKIVFTSILLSLLLVTFTSLANAQTSSPRGLANGRLIACQARENVVKNRMDSLMDLVTNMEKVFDSIAVRVETFYTNTVLPSGKTVPNYDTLVANIGNKKDLVTVALDKSKSDVAAFSCAASDPKGVLNTFRLDMQAVKGALQNYRTSIKNLIVAVHSVSPTPNPSASASPEGE